MFSPFKKCRHAHTQVKPDLLTYEAPCRLAQPLSSTNRSLLRNGGGELPRNPEGRVSLPRLRHLGYNRDGSMLAMARCCPLQEPPREHDADVYSLIEGSTPTPGVQSRVDVDESLFCASVLVGRAGRPSELAARRSLAALRRKGVWTLSLFEVLVFTYHWHVIAHQSGLGGLVIGPEGWVLQLPSNPSSRPQVGANANPIPNLASSAMGEDAAPRGQGGGRWEEGKGLGRWHREASTGRGAGRREVCRGGGLGGIRPVVRMQRDL